MLRTRFTILLLIAVSLLLVATLAAQGGDAGQYVILSAQYGTERRHVDVTGRLRELARADRPFRAGNGSFRVDPDHGMVKVLRIYARGPQGDERMFEYREGSVVDGAMFRGWRRGDWGNGGWSGRWNVDQGQYVILGAQYGTERHHVDVTDRLRELARADRPFRMGNDTFQVDPDYGVVKALRIYARGPDGRPRMFEYREGSVVDGAMFRGWGRGDWDNRGWNGGWDVDDGEFVILSAQYGTERHHVDVTRRLRELARSDTVFRMGNDTFGVDPDYGVVKVLRIYARGPNGRERMFEYREGSVVDGSRFRGWGRGEWGNGEWSGRWDAEEREERREERERDRERDRDRDR
jgi:hypothetical protein